MQRLDLLIDPTAIERLRDGFSQDAMRSAMASSLDGMYPGMQPLTAGVEATFYGADSPLSVAQREACLVGLLTLTGPPLSLGIHVYWSVMSGLSVAQVCHIVALGACYGGMPKLALGLPAVAKTLGLLASAAEAGDVSPPKILARLIDGFSTHDG